MPDLPKALIFGGLTEQMHARLSEVFDVSVPAAEDRDAFLAASGAEVEYAMLRGHVEIDGALMDRMPNLKVLSNHGVGYDLIDTAAAVERGIVVTHTPDVLNDEVANTAILLVLRRWERELRSGAPVSPKAQRYSRKLHWARLAVVWISTVQLVVIMVVIR